MKPLHFLTGITLLIIITMLLCLPGSALPKNPFFAVIHADKLVHITLFALLVVSFSYPLRRSKMTSGKRRQIIILISLAAIGYGIMMEFVQDKWIPNRSFEIGDMLADATGAITGAWISVRNWAK